MEMWSVNDRVAVKPIQVSKVTAVSENGGFATITEKRKVITAELVMDCIPPDLRVGTFPTIIESGEWAILRGDAGHRPWAKEVFKMEDGTEFILVPIGEVLGFKKES